MLSSGQGKTALVLSAGGLFGAYQAGVWSAIAPFWQPDIVVGASVGTLNGWAIAGGCAPQTLIDRWCGLGEAFALRWQVPRSPLDGVVDSGPVREEIHSLYRDFRPQVPYGLTLTRLPRPRPHLVCGDDVTADRLAAACAIPGVYRQYRLDGTLYTDGGLLEPMPLWAAAEMGGVRMVAISALPHWPWYFHAVARAMGPAVRRQLAVPPVPVLTMAPSQLLGTRWHSVAWQADNVERWVEQGYQDGINCREKLEAHLEGVRSY